MGGSGKRVKDPEKEKLKQQKEQEGQGSEKPEEQKKKGKQPAKEAVQYSVVRVSGTDLDGSKPIAHAILGIKGVGWTMSNAICEAGNIDPKKKLKDFDESGVKKIEEIIRSPVKFGVPKFMVNRRHDLETGEDVHLSGADLKVAVKFDVQRHVDLKTYRGWRHMMGQPVRGQRTRSKFRERGRVVGVLRKAMKIAPGGEKKEEKK